jgi:uncharacterized membrane protein YheB (UPF0754 family)
MEWFVSPLVGMFIGWVTNVIAIEMLFRPREAKYLVGKRLPFTPGLIPLNKKDMIAVAAEHTVSVVLDSVTDVKELEKTEQFRLFNRILDSHWATKLFVAPSKRKELFVKSTAALSRDPQIKEMIYNIIEKQMDSYDIDLLEGTVRKISNTSLKGIKFIGAFTGLVIGTFGILV